MIHVRAAAAAASAKAATNIHGLIELLPPPAAAPCGPLTSQTAALLSDEFRPAAAPVAATCDGDDGDAAAAEGGKAGAEGGGRT